VPLRKRSNETVRIDLSTPGEWVDVRRALGIDQERAIQRALLNKARAVGQVGDDGRFAIGQTYELPMGEMVDLSTFSTLEHAIVAWSFDEPVQPATIRLLDEPDVEIITKALNELYKPAPAAEERKNG
jgi:hypothetical protein